LVHLAKQFQRRRLLEIDEPVTKIAYGMAAMFVRYFCADREIQDGHHRST
jgi:hypothetical protein